MVAEIGPPEGILGTQGSNVAPLPTRIGPTRLGNYYFNDLNRYYQQRSIDIVILDDITAIEMNINNILECPRRSFLFNRGFGSRLRSFLFEPMNEQTASAIKIYMIEAISAWEPRVYVNMADTFVIPDYDQHTYYVRIVYVLKTNGSINELIRILPTQTGT